MGKASSCLLIKTKLTAATWVLLSVHPFVCGYLSFNPNLHGVNEFREGGGIVCAMKCYVAVIFITSLLSPTGPWGSQRESGVWLVFNFHRVRAARWAHTGFYSGCSGTGGNFLRLAVAAQAGRGRAVEIRMKNGLFWRLARPGRFVGHRLADSHLERTRRGKGWDWLHKGPNDEAFLSSSKLAQVEEVSERIKQADYNMCFHRSALWKTSIRTLRREELLFNKRLLSKSIVLGVSRHFH